jgi:fused signal recognition particle receptor
MFDGLKDKLSSFTEDTEEDVDVEPADDEAADDGAETTSDESAPETDGREQTESSTREDGPVESGGGGAETAGADAVHADGTAAGEEGPARAGETGGAKPADAGATEAGQTDAGATETERADTDTTETEQTDAGTAESEAAESEAADDGGRSLTQRAKLLATGKTVIDEGDLETHLEELEFALLGSDVEYEVTEEILDGVEENLLGETRGRLDSTGNIVRDALREALYDVISVGQFDFDARIAEAEKPVVIIFTGVNGVGKTTTIAKLAHYFEQRGLSTVLANGDTFRAGANEQLEQHARNLDKKSISHDQGSDPAAVIYDAVEYAEANNMDVVLGDTAGRLHTSDGLMDQLAKIDRVIEPDMTLFVDEAVAGQDAVNRAREFDDASDVDGTVLTKADADTQGGAAISIAHVTGKPILFLGTGQDYDDLERFEPERIVDSLIES